MVSQSKLTSSLKTQSFLSSFPLLTHSLSLKSTPSLLRAQAIPFPPGTNINPQPHMDQEERGNVGSTRPIFAVISNHNVKGFLLPFLCFFCSQDCDLCFRLHSVQRPSFLLLLKGLQWEEGKYTMRVYLQEMKSFLSLTTPLSLSF